MTEHNPLSFFVEQSGIRCYDIDAPTDVIGLLKNAGCKVVEVDTSYDYSVGSEWTVRRSFDILQVEPRLSRSRITKPSAPIDLIWENATVPAALHTDNGVFRQLLAWNSIQKVDFRFGGIEEGSIVLSGSAEYLSQSLKGQRVNYSLTRDPRVLDPDLVKEWIIVLHPEDVTLIHFSGDIWYALVHPTDRNFFQFFYK